MDVVVLAAGQGTRLGPLTDRRPKPVVPIANEALIRHVLRAADGVADRFLVVIGYRGQQLRDAIGDAFGGTPVSYVEQPAQVGTADAVRVATEETAGAFLVVNGDVLVEPSAIEQLAELEPPAMVGTVVSNPSEYGVLSVETGQLTGLVEKPDEPPSQLANAGVYLFDDTLAERLSAVEESERGEYELTDAIEADLDAGRAVSVLEYDGFWQDIGYPWDLLTASDYLLEHQARRINGEVASSATLEGAVVVEAGATIKAGSVIEGPALIGPEAIVGPNAYVRDGAVLGPGSTVGHAVEVKHSILFSEATASHLSYIGDSILGADVNLGAGTTVANLRHDDANVRCQVKAEPVDTGRRKFGVVLGDEVKTGINTSLNAGVVLPCNATTKPGEVVLRTR